MTEGDGELGISGQGRHGDVAHKAKTEKAVALHFRASRRPMIGVVMRGDPSIGVPGKSQSAGHALLERRACLYASEAARACGALPDDQSMFRAVYVHATDEVHFITQGREQAVYLTFAVGIKQFTFRQSKAQQLERK